MIKRIAVFASGGGTDFQSVIDANEREPFCEIALLVASKAGIGAIARAQRHGIEHIVCEKVMSRFVSLTDAIMQRSDCAELRKYLEQTMPQICSDSTEDLVSLDQLAVGQSGIVVRVSNTLRGIKKFADLGLVNGTLLQMEGHAPFGDLLRIRVMGSSLSMRAKDAAHIWLRLTE